MFNNISPFFKWQMCPFQAISQLCWNLMGASLELTPFHQALSICQILQRTHLLSLLFEKRGGGESNIND